MVQTSVEEKDSEEKGAGKRRVESKSEVCNNWKAVTVPTRVSMRQNDVLSESPRQRYQRLQISPPVTSVLKIRLLLRDFAPQNEEERYAIEDVRFYRRLNSEIQHRESPQDVISNIARWALATYVASQRSEWDGTSNDETLKYAGDLDRIRQESVAVLERFALLTGSLEVSLRLAQAVLSNDLSAATTASVAKSNVSSLPARAFRKALSRCKYKLRKRAMILKTHSTHGMVDDPNRTYKKAAFSAELSHDEINIEDDGKTVRSMTSSNSHAVLNVQFSGSGRYAWEFEIVKDAHGDEMTCIGCALATSTRIENSNYERSSELWMYRAYNGNMYARGTQIAGRDARSSVNEKYHEGDVVRCVLDLNVGTLTFSINGGEQQTTTFTNLQGLAVTPAVAFYGSDRVVTLLKVERLDRKAARFAMPSSTVPEVNGETPSQGGGTKTEDADAMVVALANLFPEYSVESLCPAAVKRMLEGRKKNPGAVTQVHDFDVVAERHRERLKNSCCDTVNLDGSVEESYWSEIAPRLSFGGERVSTRSLCIIPPPFGRVTTSFTIPTRNMFGWLTLSVGLEDSRARRLETGSQEEYKFAVRVVGTSDDDDDEKMATKKQSDDGDETASKPKAGRSGSAEALEVKCEDVDDDGGGDDRSGEETERKAKQIRKILVEWESQPLTPNSTRVQKCILRIPNGALEIRLESMCNSAESSLVVWHDPILTNAPPVLLFEGNGGATMEEKKEESEDETSSRFRVAYDSVLLPLSELVDVHEKWAGQLDKDVGDPTMLLGNGGLELPFCLEPTRRCFDVIRGIVGMCVRDGGEADGISELTLYRNRVAIVAFRLLGFNMTRLVNSHVRTEDLGLTRNLASSCSFDTSNVSSLSPLSSLRKMLEEAVHSRALSKTAREAAVEALEGGFNLLYPSPQGRSSLLTTLITRYLEAKLRPEEADYHFLRRIMLRFSSGEEVVSLLPSIDDTDIVSQSMGQGSLVKLISLLFRVAVEEALKESSRKSTATSSKEDDDEGGRKIDSDLGIGAIVGQMLRNYQRHLLSLLASASESLARARLTQAIEERDALVRAKTAALKRVRSVFVAYSRCLFCSCAKILDSVLLSLDGQRDRAILSAISRSTVGTLLSTFATTVMAIDDIEGVVSENLM
eukprot:g5369.t1